MAIKHFCDRCGAECSPLELKTIRVDGVGKASLCEGCLGKAMEDTNFESDTDRMLEEIRREAERNKENAPYRRDFPGPFYKDSGIRLMGMEQPCLVEEYFKNHPNENSVNLACNCPKCSPRM